MIVPIRDTEARVQTKPPFTLISGFRPTIHMCNEDPTPSQTKNRISRLFQSLCVFVCVCYMCVSIYVVCIYTLHTRIFVCICIGIKSFVLKCGYGCQGQV